MPQLEIPRFPHLQEHQYKFTLYILEINTTAKE